MVKFFCFCLVFVCSVTAIRILSDVARLFRRGALTRIASITAAAAVMCVVIPLSAISTGAGAESAEYPESEEYLAAPEEAVVLETLVNWRSTGWQPFNTNYVSYDDQLGFARFIVKENNKRHVWVHRLNLPIDFDQYPIFVLRYRAWNTDRRSEYYVIWLDDGKGPGRADIQPYTTDQLVPDGKIHELRKDIRQYDPTGLIKTIGVAVKCSDEADTATFDLLDLRFEAVPDADEEIIVKEDWPITVEVVGSDGRPVAGATVTVDAERPNFAFWEITDEDGKVVLDTLANLSGKHMVCVEKEGMLTVWRKDIVLEVNSAPVRIVLPYGAYYGCTVQDEYGNPIKNVTVSLRIPRLRNEKSSIKSNYTVMTDADGKWKSELLPVDLDDIWIKLSHPGYLSDSRFGGTQKPPMEDLRELQGVMVMHKALGFGGRVVDEQGNPVQGVTVKQGRDRWGSDYRATTTNKDGEFQFTQTNIGELILTLQKSGYAPVIETVTVDANSAPLEFVLKKGHTVRGKVVDLNGEPLPGILITTETYRGYSTIGWSARTDTEGRFQWNDAPEGEVLYYLWATESKEYMRVPEFPMTPSEEEYVITMPWALRISGTVVDAESEEPIKKFKLVPGMSSFVDQEPIWQTSLVKTFSDGKYEHWFTDPGQAYFICIEAEGYIPGFSSAFRSDEGDSECNFRLEKGLGFSGTVQLPDGEPLPDAEVWFCTRAQGGYVRNGRMNNRRVINTKTDKNGEFAFKFQIEKIYTLLVLHEKGYAEVTQSEFELSPEITITLWGRVEGIFKKGANPGVGKSITIYHNRPYDQNAPQIYYSYRVMTNSEGRFAFEKVIAGPAKVAHELRLSDRRTTSTHSTPVMVIPGETVFVTLGGTGRPVIGRVVLPKDTKREVKWGYGRSSIHSKEQADRGAQRNYGVIMKSDGSFRVEDVPAGNYQLDIRVHEPPTERYRGWGKQIGDLYHEFEIPKMEGGRSDEVFDLGELTLNLYGTLDIGDTAPDFTVKTFEDTKITLSDYRGKAVLLCFWTRQLGDELEFLQKVYQAYGEEEDFMVLSVAFSYGNDTATIQEYIQQNQLQWTQTLDGEWSKTQLRYDYGIQRLPAIFLVDLEGKIAGINLRGGQIRSAVEKLLGKEHIMPVKPTVGVGDITFGMKEEDVIKYLGAPEQIEDNGIMYKYLSKGLTVGISPLSGVGLFECYTKKSVWPSKGVKDFKGATDKGIKLGSSRKEIIAAYGKPDEIYEKPVKTELTYRKLGLKFVLKSDKLFRFIMTPVK